ncbi:hypothetical protein Y032_0004g1801 [Ancylostoma ceylanicum]|uniref:SCP domain-containing protein n=1 Tax=Ancylostoma ceylanicum TaxID=53326 RepID=A0A016VVQ1_9BILA|nr:hypothetical protein Y032_0004g1801 [Ancylostoma ceylanicum]
MLLVMAIVMEWAYQTYTVPDKLVKKHTEWCHSYSIMNMFMNEKKNVHGYIFVERSKLFRTVCTDGVG